MCGSRSPLRARGRRSFACARSRVRHVADDDPVLLESQLRDLLVAIRKRSSSKVIDQWTLDGDALLTRLLAAGRKTANSGGVLVPLPSAYKLALTTAPSSSVSNAIAFGT